MEEMNFDCKISLFGYDKGYIDDVLREKDKKIELQERDVLSLKNEISKLKYKISRSKKRKK